MDQKREAPRGPARVPRGDEKSSDSPQVAQPSRSVKAPDLLAAAQIVGERLGPVHPCRLDKRPYLKVWQNKATRDSAEIEAQWRRFPGASIGLVMGPASGLFCLDVDLPAGPASLAALEAEHGPLPPTLTQRTGSGGMQYFFRRPEGREVRNSAGKIGRGLDIRGAGGYSIVAPSPHPSGGRYNWTSPKGVAPAEAPAWLLALICAPANPQPRQLRPVPARGGQDYGQAALEAEAGKVAVAPDGQRNATLNAAAFSLGQLVAGGQVARAEAEEALAHAAARAGLPADEAAKTIRSGLTAGERSPRKPAPGKKSAPPAAQGLHVGQPFNFFDVFRGSFIPNSLLRYPGLTPTGKLMWARLGQFCGRNGYCWPSIARLAKELGLSTRQVHRVIAELEQKGFLRRTPPSQQDKGRRITTSYELLWHEVFCATTDAGDTCRARRSLMSRTTPKCLHEEENFSSHESGLAQNPGRGGRARG